MEEPIPKADAGDKTEQVINFSCPECCQCLQMLSAFSFSDLFCGHLHLTNRTVTFLLEVSLLNSLCHSNIKLTITLEATTVYGNPLGPPQAQYFVQ